MSNISKIFGSYKKALDDSISRYQDLYSERVKNAQDFYQEFFRKLIKQYEPLFSNAKSLKSLYDHISKFFEKKQIDFIAIDGTCSKDPFRDFITFFGGAYGAKGSLFLEEDPPKVKYQKWAMDKDVSMVAYIPIPFAQLSDVTDTNMAETFIVSDADRIDLSNIQTLIMQLAEIFLAYNVVTTSEGGSPKLLMMDLSPSSLMASVAAEPSQVHLMGHYPYNGRRINKADIAIAYAHPFNKELGIPGVKKFKIYSLIVAEFHYLNENQPDSPQSIDIAKFVDKHGLSKEDIRRAINYIEQHGIAKREDKFLKALVNVNDSWEYVKSFFQHLCKRLFIEKDQSALIYNSPDENGAVRRRWLSPMDIRFLISVGIRALVEECWERRVLLTGVIKDSSSRYLSRNYLGVAKHLNIYPKLNELQFHQLPWTDRIFLETLPLCDENLNAPWSSIEIDSAFMTLFLYQGEQFNSPYISGVKGTIVSNEKLFARSLAQFFLSRKKSTPLMGHVVFIDRLLYPEWDSDKLDQLVIETDKLGKVSLFCCKEASVPNIGQDIVMYFLSILTRNHFPEVIGYPDPLHKADWGAKSIGRKVRELIKSSEISFRAKPLSKTFRTIRDSIRRS